MSSFCQKNMAYLNHVKFVYVAKEYKPLGPVFFCFALSLFLFCIFNKFHLTNRHTHTLNKNQEWGLSIRLKKSCNLLATYNSLCQVKPTLSKKNDNLWQGVLHHTMLYGRHDRIPLYPPLQQQMEVSTDFIKGVPCTVLTT